MIRAIAKGDAVRTGNRKKSKEESSSMQVSLLHLKLHLTRALTLPQLRKDARARHISPPTRTEYQCLFVPNAPFDLRDARTNAGQEVGPFNLGYEKKKREGYSGRKRKLRVASAIRLKNCVKRPSTSA
ncbi:unnamed protein product [Lasius platythorax]|uniref:Uncharacterized protein n=1 Tax=Lasius platythorax TaxID=488582 RepID=A0AAV2NNI6_9HYME